MIITQKEFNKFLVVRRDGQHNMFSPFAREEANLDKSKWKYIMSNFDELIKKYGDLV